MEEKKWTIIVGFIIGGIAYWLISTDQMESGSGTYPLLVFSIGAFIGAALLMLMLNTGELFRISLFLSIGAALAVLARIIYDGIFIDAGSHSLAPFEIILWGFITFICALAGSLVVVLIRKMIK